jgi:hypothetical protein
MPASNAFGPEQLLGGIRAEADDDEFDLDDPEEGALGEDDDLEDDDYDDLEDDDYEAE